MVDQQPREFDPALPTPKDKLRNLEQFMPGLHGTIYAFGGYVADHINDELVPQGFVLGATLAAMDIARGIDSRTNRPIEGPAGRLTDTDANFMIMYIPLIAKAVYPEDFAQGVEEFLNEVNQSIRANPRPENLLVKHDVQLPGKDPFKMLDNHETIPTSGIIVSANVRKGSHGVFEVYRYNNVETSLDDKRAKGYDFERLSMNFEYNQESQRLDFAIEPSNYVGKLRQPYDRGDTTTYMGTSFGQLDIIDLSNDRRLLIAKETDPIGNLHTSFDWKGNETGEDSRTRETLSLFDYEDLDGVVDCIRVIARDLVVLPEQDIDLITQEVAARMQASKQS